MARRSPRPAVSRRKFLAGVAVASAATVTPGAGSPAAAASSAAALPHKPSTLPPALEYAALESGSPQESSRIGGVPGSDFMVDVIKTLEIKYLPANPASSFRGLHESLINYGGNKMPEFLTAAHEESAVGMAHGYFKVAGKPLMTLCHGSVGLQHAAMAIYNAWCDRVPAIIVGGNDLDAAHRPPACPPFTRRRTSMRWCGISPNGTTRRFRYNISRSLSCAPTRLR
jgi:acetolactate synthase I/II/III large subunit